MSALQWEVFIARQEIQVDKKVEKLSPKENLRNSKLKDASSSLVGKRKDYQKELSTNSTPKTVTEKVKQTNRRIEDDVILHSGTSAKQIKSSTLNNQRRAVETNQINQNLNSPSLKKKRRGRSRVSLRLAKSNISKTLDVDDLLDDLQEDVRGNSDNLSAIEAAEKELATKLNGIQLAEQVTSQNNEIQSKIELLEKQNLSEKEIKFVEEKYDKVSKISENIAKYRYGSGWLYNRKLLAAKNELKKEISELKNLFLKHPFLEESFNHAKNEVQDYYSLKFIQIRIHNIAKRQAGIDVVQFENHKSNSEICREQWEDFKSSIEKELLHRRPELKDTIKEMYNKAYSYEFGDVKKGIETAEKILSLLKGKIDYNKIFYAIRKLNHRSFTAMCVHYKKLSGRHIFVDFDKKMSNYGTFGYHTGNKDSVFDAIKSTRNRKAKEYQGINIDNLFSVKEKKEELKKRIRVKAFSAEANMLTLALRGKSSISEALISLSKKTEATRKKIKDEIKKVYGDKFLGLSKSRQELLDKAFNGIEIKKDDLIELALEEFISKGILHGKILASQEYTASEFSTNLDDTENDFSALIHNNKNLKEIFLKAYNRALTKTRSEEVLIVYNSLLSNEKRVEGINKSDSIKKAGDIRDKQKIYLASQDTFISNNPELAKKIKAKKSEIDKKFRQHQDKVGKAAYEFYRAGSNYKKAREIIINLNGVELDFFAETFKEYGLTLEEHIVKKFTDYGGLYREAGNRKNLLKLITNRRTPKTEFVRTKNTSQTIDVDLIEAAKQSLKGDSLKSELLILNDSLKHPFGAIRLYDKFSKLSESKRREFIQGYNQKFGNIEDKVKKVFKDKNLKIALACINGEKVSNEDFVENVHNLIIKSGLQYGNCMAGKQSLNANEAKLEKNELLSYVNNNTLKDIDCEKLKEQLKTQFNAEVRHAYAQSLTYLLIQNAYRRGIENGKSTSFINHNYLKKLKDKKEKILKEHSVFIKEQGSNFNKLLKEEEEKAYEKGIDLTIACGDKVRAMDHACNGNLGWGVSKDKLFNNMRARSPEERALIQELYKHSVGHSVQWELQDELGGYNLDKGEAIMRGNIVSELTAEAALALRAWWRLNPDEGRTLHALETLLEEDLKDEGANLRQEFLDRFNNKYAPDFSKKNFKDISDGSFNEKERDIRDQCLKGDKRSVSIAKLKHAKKAEVAIELEKLVLDPFTGKVDPEKLKKLEVELRLSNGQTLSNWVKNRFLETSTFTVWNYDYNYMKWALALVDGEGNAHLRARAHKINYAIKGVGTSKMHLEAACSASQELVLAIENEGKDNNSREEKEKAEKQVKEDAKYIKEFYKKNYKSKSFKGDAVKDDISWDITGILVEVELYRLENAVLSPAQKLKHAIGNDDLNAAMSILQGKTKTKINELEKEILASTEAKGMFAGKYDSLKELIEAHFALDDQRQLTIELIGLPDFIPSGEIPNKGDKRAALKQIKELVEARYENARLGIDAISDLLTSTGVKLDKETNEIIDIIDTALEKGELPVKQSERLEILIKRQGRLSTGHCQEAASLGDTVSNYASAGVLITGVVVTSILTKGAAIPFWSGVFGSAGLSLTTRVGTRTLVVGSNTASYKNLRYDIGMGSLDGISFGLSSKITGKIASSVYNKIANRIGTKVTSEFVTESGEQASKFLIGQSIVEKTLLRRIGMRTFEGMLDGTITGYAHGAATVAFDQKTWEKGFVEGLLYINYNGTMGGGTGLVMGGTLALPFSFIKPPIVKMSEKISAKKALRGGLLERIGIENTFLNTIGKKFKLSRHKMSKAEVKKALETKGVITKGDIEISRLNSKKLSKKESKKLLNKADKLLKQNKLTSEQINKLNKLNNEGKLTKLHKAQIKGTAPAYVVKKNQKVIKRMQERAQKKLEAEAIAKRVKNDEEFLEILSEYKISFELKNKIKNKSITKMEDLDKYVNDLNKHIDPTNTLNKDIEIVQGLKARNKKGKLFKNKDFLEELKKQNISDELRKLIKDGHIYSVECLDKYVNTSLASFEETIIIPNLKDNAEKALLNAKEQKRSDSFDSDNVNLSTRNEDSSSINNRKDEKTNTSNKEASEDSKLGKDNNGSGNETSLDGSGSNNSSKKTKENSDGENVNNKNEDGPNNNSNNNKNGKESSNKDVDGVTKAEKDLVDSVNNSNRNSKNQNKGNSNDNTPDNTVGRSDENLENNRYLTKEELDALDNITSNLEPNSRYAELRNNIYEKRNKNLKITAKDLEDWVSASYLLKEDLPDILSAYASKRFKGNTPSSSDTSKGDNKTKNIDADSKALQRELEETKKRVERVRKENHRDFESNEYELKKLEESLGKAKKEVTENNLNKDELDHKSIQERNKEIKESIDEINRALDLEEDGFSTSLYDNPSYDVPSDFGGGVAPVGLASKKKITELQAIADRLCENLGKAKPIKPKPKAPTESASQTSKPQIETPTPKLAINTDISLQSLLRSGIKLSLRNGLQHASSPKNSYRNQPAKQKSSVKTKSNQKASTKETLIPVRPKSRKRPGKPKKYPDFPSFGKGDSRNKKYSSELDALLNNKMPHNKDDNDKYIREHDPNYVRYKVVTIKGNIYRQRFERSTQASSNDQWVMTYSQLIGKVEDGQGI